MSLLSSEQKTQFQKLKSSFSIWIKKNNGDLNDVDDIVQEAFISYYEKTKLTKFNIPNNIDAYLFSTAKYIWYKELKRRKIITQIPKEMEIHDSDSNYLHLPSGINLNNDLINKMETCLKKLNSKARKLIELFYYESKSMLDIAAELGYSNPDSAKTAKNKYMLQIKKCTQSLAS